MESYQQNMDVEMQHARERTNMINDFREGNPIEGLGDEMNKVSKTVEAKLREKGTGTEFKAADVLEAQRRLVQEKDLAERFMRIKRRLEELQTITAKPGASVDLRRVQFEMESLRPLVLLIIRSGKFRELMSSSLEILRKVIDRINPEEKVEKVTKATEQKGVAAGKRAAKRQVKKAGQQVKKMAKEDRLIKDDEWNQLTEKLEVLVRDLQKHPRYREGVDQLFALGSQLRSQFNEIKREGVVELSRREEKVIQEVQEEATGIIKEFSGKKALDDVYDSINHLFKKFENNERIDKWWDNFQEQTKKVLRSYKNKEDLDQFRKLFDEAYDIFDDFSDDIDKVIDNLETLVDNITNDKLVKDLREKVGTLSDELLWTDQYGNTNVDTTAAKDLAAAVGEAIRNEFKYLALPGIRMKDGDTMLVLDDVVLTATLPENISFHLETYANFNTRTLDITAPGKTQQLGAELNLTVKIKDVTLSTCDTHFTYTGGMISDSGIFSLAIPKPGADLTVDFVLRPSQQSAQHVSPVWNLQGTQETGEIGSGGRYSFVKVNTNLEIPDLDVKFKTETMKHPYLIPMYAAFFKQSIISDMEYMMENLLNEALKKLGEGVASILNQAQNPLSLSSLGQMTRSGVEAFVE